VAEPQAARPPEPSAERSEAEERGLSAGRAAREEALGLNRLIHERMRLAIVSALAVSESLTFNELKRLLETTDGNLSVHARKLEEARYITCTKTFEGRLPRTEYRLSAAGKQALEHYLDHMEALIRTMRDRRGGPDREP
jgi:DNA-binding HxlR family transcriptional regulator